MGDEEFLIDDTGGRDLLEWIRKFDDIHIVKLDNRSTQIENIYFTHYAIWDDRVAAMFLLRWKP